MIPFHFHLLLWGGMENIRQHTFTLARYTYVALSSLRYPNGAPVVQIYSDSDFSSPEVQGPVISFNVLDDNGNIIGYSQVGFLFILPTCAFQNRSYLQFCSHEIWRQGLWALAIVMTNPVYCWRGHWSLLRVSVLPLTCNSNKHGRFSSLAYFIQPLVVTFN